MYAHTHTHIYIGAHMHVRVGQLCEHLHTSTAIRVRMHACASPARTSQRGRVVALALSSLSPIHTTQARDDRGACGWGYSGRGGRRTRSPRAHPHPRSANPPFWFSGGAERRHNRRARTTTHTTPSSRRVAYLARRSRDPRSARCSAHLTPRTGGRGDRACAAAPPLQAFFVTFQNKMTGNLFYHFS